MKTYTIYFEIFGKKMKTNVAAYSEEAAKEQIRNKILFNKITGKDLFAEELKKDNPFKDFFGIFK